jgi:hypothetical protein
MLRAVYSFSSNFDAVGLKNILLNLKCNFANIDKDYK